MCVWGLLVTIVLVLQNMRFVYAARSFIYGQNRKLPLLYYLNNIKKTLLIENTLPTDLIPRLKILSLIIILVSMYSGS